MMIFSAIFFKLDTNVDQGYVCKSEPYFGFILNLMATFVLLVFAKKGIFEIVSMNSSFIEETCDNI